MGDLSAAGVTARLSSTRPFASSRTRNGARPVLRLTADTCRSTDA
jgi:hypothetical protein